MCQCVAVGISLLELDEGVEFHDQLKGKKTQ